MLPERPFYLIRHGESEANAARVCAGGQYDSPLTAKGRAQARSLAPYLERLEVAPAAIWHSSMNRARETAEILNTGISLSMTERHDLREHDLGKWDGLHWDVVLPKLDNREVPPDGETYQQFTQRIQYALTEIFTTNSGLPMVVAHGGLFHALGMLYEYGMSPIQNCHLHYFEPDQSLAQFPWRVWQFDIAGKKLEKRPAPFCLSQALARIA